MTIERSNCHCFLMLTFTVKWGNLFQVHNFHHSPIYCSLTCNLHPKQYLPHFDQISKQCVFRGWLHTIVAITKNVQYCMCRCTLLFWRLYLFCHWNSPHFLQDIIIDINDIFTKMVAKNPCYSCFSSSRTSHENNVVSFLFTKNNNNSNNTLSFQG